ncbi:MAG: hypothetical protein ACI8P0_003779 [Planctomycetaceae bacterium]|jgi:hypothetical protein
MTSTVGQAPPDEVPNQKLNHELTRIDTNSKSEFVFIRVD